MISDIQKIKNMEEYKIAKLRQEELINGIYNKDFVFIKNYTSKYRLRFDELSSFLLQYIYALNVVFEDDLKLIIKYYNYYNHTNYGEQSVINSFSKSDYVEKNKNKSFGNFYYYKRKLESVIRKDLIHSNSFSFSTEVLTKYRTLSFYHTKELLLFMISNLEIDSLYFWLNYKSNITLSGQMKNMISETKNESRSKLEIEYIRINDIHNNIKSIKASYINVIKRLMKKENENSKEISIYREKIKIVDMKLDIIKKLLDELIIEVKIEKMILSYFVLCNSYIYTKIKKDDAGYNYLELNILDNTQNAQLAYKMFDKYYNALNYYRNVSGERINLVKINIVVFGKNNAMYYEKYKDAIVKRNLQYKGQLANLQNEDISIRCLRTEFEELKEKEITTFKLVYKEVDYKEDKMILNKILFPLNKEEENAKKIMELLIAKYEKNNCNATTIKYDIKDKNLFLDYKKIKNKYKGVL